MAVQGKDSWPRRCDCRLRDQQIYRQVTVSFGAQNQFLAAMILHHEMAMDSGRGFAAAAPAKSEIPQMELQTNDSLVDRPAPA